MSEHAIANAKAWLENIREMTGRLGDPDLLDDAREEIEQSPLSVLVRGGWTTPGGATEPVDAEEFEILLSTGGPALRILGTLDGYAEPDGFDLQWQDWGTPWTSLPLDGDELVAVEAFARCFYFGGG